MLLAEMQLQEIFGRNLPNSGPRRLTGTFAKAAIEIRLIDHGLVGTELFRR